LISITTSGYELVRKTFQEHDTSYQSQNWYRMVTLRRGPTTVRLERPVNLPRAREVGYKAKQGFVICVTKVRRGTLNKIRPNKGRKNANLGVNKITPKKNLQWIAEERTQKKYPNLEVLNSYQIGADGSSHFFEIILVDPSHPSIIADPKINWIGRKNNYHRALRGLTSAGKKTRSLRSKGLGAEKIRPSLRANGNMR
jgi:large subunit ribosomal protein L15e